MIGMAEVVWMPIPVHLAGEVQQLINARMVIQIDAEGWGSQQSSTGMIWE
jgi:hypothetical protein